MSDWSPGDGDYFRYLLDDLERLRVAEKRVREIHYADSNGTGECWGCPHAYPCPTIEALDGAE